MLQKREIEREGEGRGWEGREREEEGKRKEYMGGKYVEECEVL